MIPLFIIHQEFDITEFEEELRDFEKSLSPSEKKEFDHSEPIGDSYKVMNKKVFKFNPNKANEKELQSLGFSERVVQNIIKYRLKGGVFYKKTDLLKIYGIDTLLYYTLAPFIYLNEISNDKKQIRNDNKYIPVIEHSGLLDINSAEADLLRKVPGIDSSLSETIIKYRNLLGGYYHKMQFEEIYGIKKEQINILHKKVFIDTTLITKINLNMTDLITLGKHPYLNIYQSKAIIKYKNFKGEITNLCDLVNNNILTRDIFLKIRPYLSAD